MQIWHGSVKIKLPGKRTRTIILPRPLAKEVLELSKLPQQNEMWKLLLKIWHGAAKSNHTFYYYPSETNPDIPEAEL